MNKNICLAVSAIILGAGFQNAFAQEESKGLSIRAGGMIPFGRHEVTLEDNTKKTNPKFSFSGGIDYKLPSSILGDLGQEGSVEISADYCSFGERNNIPLLVNYRGKSEQFEYSVGIGAGYGREFNTTEKKFKNKMNFSWQLSGRYYFQKSSETPFFVEGRYNGCTKSELNGFSIQIGTSF